MLIRIRSTSVSSLRLRLAETLGVASVTSVEYGRLLHLRIRSQNTVVVNLPRSVPQDSDLTLVVTYAGEVPNQELDSDTIAVAPDAQEQSPTSELREPALLLSNRSYWYPQNPVPDYATASLAHLRPVRATRASRAAIRFRPSEVVSLRDILSGPDGSGVLRSAPISRCDIWRWWSLALRASAKAASSFENQTDPGSGVDSIAVSVASHRQPSCAKPAGAAGGREHPAVLFVAHGRCAVHVGRHRTARKRPARRTQPRVLCRHQHAHLVSPT